MTKYAIVDQNNLFLCPEIMEDDEDQITIGFSVDKVYLWDSTTGAEDFLAAERETIVAQWPGAELRAVKVTVDLK